MPTKIVNTSTPLKIVILFLKNRYPFLSAKIIHYGSNDKISNAFFVRESNLDRMVNIKDKNYRKLFQDYKVCINGMGFYGFQKKGGEDSDGLLEWRYQIFFLKLFEILPKDQKDIVINPTLCGNFEQIISALFNSITMDVYNHIHSFYNNSLSSLKKDPQRSLRSKHLHQTNISLLLQSIYLQVIGVNPVPGDESLL